MVSILYMNPLGYVSPEYRLVHDGAVTDKMIQKSFEFDQQTSLVGGFNPFEKY